MRQSRCADLAMTIKFSRTLMIWSIFAGNAAPRRIRFWRDLPHLTPSETFLQYFAALNATGLSAFSSLPTARRSSAAPTDQLVSQVVSDRLNLAGLHLKVGDQLLTIGKYRTSITRHYYAMYHGARAIAYADFMGDDHQSHRDLPNHLPSRLPNQSALSSELSSARLLRNEADYDLYPVGDDKWESEARRLAVTASSFCSACEAYALQEGII